MDRKSQQLTVIFTTRLKRKKGRKFPIVVLGEKSIEERLNRKIDVSGKHPPFQKKKIGVNFFAGLVVRNHNLSLSA